MSEDGVKRGKSKGCPFLLPIPLGCKNIGNRIKNINPIRTESGLDYSNLLANFKNLFYAITGSEKEKRRCPYAKEIDGNSNMVICTFKCSHKDTELQNAQISNTQFPISGSPTQINVFDTNPTNNGLPLYGDSSFNDDNIREIPLGLANVGRDNPKLT